VVCISRTTAEDLISYIESNPISRTSKFKVGYWHLGANFSKKLGNEGLDIKISDMSAKSYILMVGTIEPRKSHELALNAMELLWEQGSELCLCIAGKEGWMVGHLIERFRQHPQLNKKLFFFEGPSDADVHFLYGNSLALFFPSKGEGFGLPLIEAANHGIPIVCSDIPVFHEIASEYATYVNTSDAFLLANDLGVWWENYQKKNIPLTSSMPRLTWEQSSEMLLNILVKGEWLREVK
jgi:glycosyltransferase involved in cell wall biosynthesis